MLGHVISCQIEAGDILQGAKNKQNQNKNTNTNKYKNPKTKNK